jgi:DNA-binding HxlR family transcriptional regulator
MKKVDTSQWPTSMARSFAIFGDHWNLTILMQSLMGARRFEDYQKPTNISRSILRQRLEGLISVGVMKKVQYQSKPPRFHYRLTEKGLDTVPILYSMATWEEKFNSATAPVPQRYWHSICGNPSHPKIVCSQCDEPYSALNVAVEFVTPEAVAFALNHCANPIMVKSE